MCCQSCHEPAVLQPGPWGVCPQPWYSYVPVPFYYYVPCCPACGGSAGACTCSQAPAFPVPQELDVDLVQKTATRVVGGAAEVKLILEYLPANDPNAGDAEVTLEVTTDSGTSKTDVKPVPAGFHVNDSFPEAAPGTKLTLTANNCYARLRWCERVEY